MMVFAYYFTTSGLFICRNEYFPSVQFIIRCYFLSLFVVIRSTLFVIEKYLFTTKRPLEFSFSRHIFIWDSIRKLPDPKQKVLRTKEKKTRKIVQLIKINNKKGQHSVGKRTKDFSYFVLMKSFLLRFF